MFKFIRNWIWRRQRDMDVDILWSALVATAPTLEAAHEAFLYHARNDPAWYKFYGDRLEEEVLKLR